MFFSHCLKAKNKIINHKIQSDSKIRLQYQAQFWNCIKHQVKTILDHKNQEKIWGLMLHFTTSFI